MTQRCRRQQSRRPTRDQHATKHEPCVCLADWQCNAQGAVATMTWRWLLLALLPVLRAMVIQRVTGANQSEVSHASSAGGGHVYLFGTDIGSAFSPPTVYVGLNADAQCVVQPFTSNRNRLHCILSGDGLPAPDISYSTTAKIVSEPLRVYKDGRLADCWHVGGLNHGCFLNFDVAGTPRVTKVLTPVVEAGGFVRVVGHGIDGGLTGDPKILSALHRGSRDAGLGSCGQKDCQASNMGTETIGCVAREGGDEGVPTPDVRTSCAPTRCMCMCMCMCMCSHALHVHERCTRARRACTRGTWAHPAPHPQCLNAAVGRLGACVWAGDSVLGQRFAVSLAFSDDNSYGCQLDTLASECHPPQPLSTSRRAVRTHQRPLPFQPCPLKPSTCSQPPLVRLYHLWQPRLHHLWPPPCVPAQAGSSVASSTSPSMATTPCTAAMPTWASRARAASTSRRGRDSISSCSLASPVRTTARDGTEGERCLRRAPSPPLGWTMTSPPLLPTR